MADDRPPLEGAVRDASQRRTSSGNVVWGMLDHGGVGPDAA
jgi:hypothetical protein